MQTVTLDPSDFPAGKDNTVALQSFLDAHRTFTINWPANAYIDHDRTLRNPVDTTITGALDTFGVPNCGTRLLTDTGGYLLFDQQRVRNAWDCSDGCTFKNFDARGHKDPTKGRSPTVTDPTTGKTYRNVWEAQHGFALLGVEGVTLCTTHANHHWGDGFSMGGSGSGTSVKNCDGVTLRYTRSYDTGRMAYLLSGVSNLEVWNWEAEKYASGCFHTEMSANPLQDQSNWQIRDGHDYGGGDFLHIGSGQRLDAVQVTGNLVDGQWRCYIVGKKDTLGNRLYTQWNVSNNVWTATSGELFNLWNVDGFLFQGNVGFIKKGQPYFDPTGLATCLNVRGLPSENKITVVS
jgi:hypothetical protein